MPYDTIRYDVREGIATITLTRPEKLNAFTMQMMQEMIDALDHADADDAVGVVIVTGEGRAFCAGSDLSLREETFLYDDDSIKPDGSYDYSAESTRDIGGKLTLRLFNSLKPVIAAINGPAVGIGITMTLAMDVRLASEDARIGFVFARRGMIPEAASAFFLPRIVGISQALRWCYSGRVFPAAEAQVAGLVDRVVPRDTLMAAAHEMAREIIDNSAPISVALTRQMLWRGLGLAHPMQAHKVDSRGIFSRARSADAAEGISSFLDKRPAKFTEKVSSDMPDFFPWWEEPEYR